MSEFLSPKPKHFLIMLTSIKWKSNSCLLIGIILITLFYWPHLPTAGTDQVSTSNMLKKQNGMYRGLSQPRLFVVSALGPTKKSRDVQRCCCCIHLILCAYAKKTSSCKHLHQPYASPPNISQIISKLLKSKEVPVLPSESVRPPHDHLFCLCSSRWLRSCVRRITASKCSCSMRGREKRYLHSCPLNHKD